MLPTVRPCGLAARVSGVPVGSTELLLVWCAEAACSRRELFPAPVLHCCHCSGGDRGPSALLPDSAGSPSDVFSPPHSYLAELTTDELLLVKARVVKRGCVGDR